MAFSEHDPGQQLDVGGNSSIPAPRFPIQTPVSNIGLGEGASSIEHPLDSIYYNILHGGH
jgi:hypothetical protein